MKKTVRAQYAIRPISRGLFVLIFTALLCRGYISTAVTTWASRVSGYSPTVHLRLNESSSVMANSGSLGASADGAVSGSMTRAASSLLLGDANACVDLTGGTVTTPAVISNTTALTISVLINFNSFAADVDYLSVGSQSGSQRHAILRYQRSSDTVRYVYANGTIVQAFTWNVPETTNKNYFLTLTHDDSAKQIKSYVNGRLIGSTTYSGSYLAITNKALVIGSTSFSAKVDEVLISTSAITQAQTILFISQPLGRMMQQLRGTLRCFEAL